MYWHGAAEVNLPDSVTEWCLLVSSKLLRDDKRQRHGILWNKRVLIPLVRIETWLDISC